MGFSRQEYWSGLPFSSPGDPPDPGILPATPLCLLHWQADSLSLSYLGSPYFFIPVSYPQGPPTMWSAGSVLAAPLLWLGLVPASSSRGQMSSLKGQGQYLCLPMTSGTQPALSQAFFMDVFHASVVLPAHLIWSSPATVCLSLHTETMFGMIQPSSQATDWPWGARGTGARAETRAGTRVGSQTRGS